MSKLKVAICDDSLLVRKKFKASLEDFDVSVVFEAKDGNDVVEKLKDNPEVDVLFMDIVMPNKTGIEALEEIKATEELKDLKVVMVTSVGTSTHVKEAVKLGVFDFMQKPVDVTVLASILDRVRGEV
ncbi:MAG: response regulator [Bacillaceae bacterium]|nr:response regulator [Bacillaceae bacterium]